MTENKKNEWFKLSKASRTFLFIILTIFLLLSTIYAGYLIFFKNEMIKTFNIEQVSIFGCLTYSLLGSSIFYIRKLYKSCINLDVVEPINENDKIREIGVIFYYLLRPIFSIGLSFILYLSLKIGVNAMTKNSDLEDGFVYSCMFFSFFIGYSSGDVIDKLEKVGKNIVNRSFESSNDN